MHRYGNTCLFGILLILAAGTAFAQPPEPVLLQQWDDFPVSGFAVDGSDAWGYANLAGAVYELHHIDLSAEDGGEVVLELPSRGYGIDSENGVVVVAAGWEGMYVLDGSDPENVILLTTFRMPGEPQDVVLRDGYAYVACDYSGLVTVDLADPANPVITEYSRVGDCDAVQKVAVEQDRAFVYAAYHGFVSYDLTIPSTPVPIDTLPDPFAPGWDKVTTSLAVSDDRIGASLTTHVDAGFWVETNFYQLYAEHNDGLFPDECQVQEFGSAVNAGSSAFALHNHMGIMCHNMDSGIYDLSEPTQLDPVYFYPDSTFGLMRTSNDILYALNNNRLQAYSLTGDPTTPPYSPGELVQVNRVPRGRAPHAVSAPPSNDTHAQPVLAETDEWVFNELTRLTVPDAESIEQVIQRENAVYLVDVTNDNISQVIVIDVSDLYSPAITGIIPNLEGTNYDITVTDQWMIISVESGLKFYDITDPLNPYWIATAELDEVLYKIAAYSNRLYGLTRDLQYGSYDLYTYDISDPNNVIQIDQIKDAGREVSVSDDGEWLLLYYERETWDNYTIISSCLYSLTLTSDCPYPLKFTPEAHLMFGDPYIAYECGFLDELTFVSFSAYEYSSFQFTDISDTLYPVTTFSLSEYLGDPGGAARQDNLLLLGSFDPSTTVLAMYDISDPFNPEPIATDHSLLARAFVLEWPYLYGAQDNEFAIYSLSETAVEDSADPSATLPHEFAIHSAFPNPFNPATTITVELPQSALATLTIYDITGREVARLLDGELQEGRHRVEFDGSGLASGVYLARFDAAGVSDTRKLVLLK